MRRMRERATASPRRRGLAPRPTARGPIAAPLAAIPGSAARRADRPATRIGLALVAAAAARPRERGQADGQAERERTAGQEQLGAGHPLHDALLSSVAKAVRAHPAARGADAGGAGRPAAEPRLRPRHGIAAARACDTVGRGGAREVVEHAITPERRVAAAPAARRRVSERGHRYRALAHMRGLRRRGADGCARAKPHRNRRARAVTRRISHNATAARPLRGRAPPRSPPAGKHPPLRAQFARWPRPEPCRVARHHAAWCGDAAAPHCGRRSRGRSRLRHPPCLHGFALPHGYRSPAFVRVRTQANRHRQTASGSDASAAAEPLRTPAPAAPARRRSAAPRARSGRGCTAAAPARAR